MSGEQDWRFQTDAETMLGAQKKTLAVADRRPVIRKAADLVGPGINAQATRITDYNNLLATYNGYYSSVAGAFGAPSDTEDFVGITVMDSLLGGFQLFTGLGTGTGKGATYRRRFHRNPADASSIFWDAWVNESTPAGEPVGMIGVWMKATPPAKHLILDGSSFSGTTYPDLAAFLGGTTLPDLRDRTVYGVGSAWTLLATDGLAAGSRSKNLPHEHRNAVQTAGDHAHTVSGDGSHNHGGITGVSTVPTTLTTGGGAVDRAGPDTSHAHTISNAGSTHAHTMSTTGNHQHVSYTQQTGDAYDVPPVLRGIGMNWIIRAVL